MGSGTYRGLEVDVQDKYIDGLSQLEGIVAHVALDMEPNAPLAYALGLELNNSIMSTLAAPGG